MHGSHMRWILLLGMLVLATLWESVGCAPPPPTPVTKCTQDKDCPGSQICVKNACQYTSIKTETQTESHAETGTEVRAEVRPEPPTESPRETSPEPLVEPTSPEPTQTDSGPTEQPPEGCRSGATKPCTHSCGPGTQTCTDGAWKECVPDKVTRPCYTGPKGTEGKGICKAGIETCTNGKWGTCQNETLPQTEVCSDGQDNDCNGQTDEASAGCQCINGKTQPCGSSVGACRQGTQTCQNAKWGPCQGQTIPSQEICDNIDNDCNGRIDETFTKLGQTCSVGVGACTKKGTYICNTQRTDTTCNAVPGKGTIESCNNIDDDCDGYVDDGLSQPCYPAGVNGCVLVSGKWSCKGSCLAGKQTCKAGKWGSCTSYVTPKTEQCRDGKDNDCDGAVDETCGAAWPFFYAASNSKLVKSYAPKNTKISYTRLGIGRYELGPVGLIGCSSKPLFLTVADGRPHPVSYTCDGSKYKIYVGVDNYRTAKAADAPLSGVVLQTAGNDVWGTVNSSCKISVVGGTAYPCKQGASHNKATALRLGTGVYHLNTSACKSPNQPMLASIVGNVPNGFVTISYRKTGSCLVQTFDLYGAPADRDFLYWLPEPTAFAWAVVASTGKLLASHTFKDQWTTWKTQTVAGKYHTITYAGSGQPSAAFTTARSNSTALVSPPLITTNVPSGIQLYGVNIKSFKQSFSYTTVLFMQ